MKLHLVAAGLLAFGLLTSRPAAALTISIAKTMPVLAGQPVTFHLAPITDAVGTVSLRWDFGDATVIDAAPPGDQTHTYQTAGHYSVIVKATDDTGLARTSFVQTAANPATATRPSNSSSVVIDAEQKRVWVTNPDSDTVSVIDQALLTRLREVPVGREPHSLAQAPDKSIWVTNEQSDEVVVINRDTFAVDARIALPYASAPRSIAFGSSGMAYVSLFGSGKVVEIDGTTRKMGRSLALGPTPFGVSVSADGRIFVTRFLSPVDHGEVWVVSPQTFTLASTIMLPFDMGPDTQSSGRGVPNDVFSMVISPDGTQALVTAKKDDVARGKQRDGMAMGADNFVRTALCKIDMKTLTEVVDQRQDVDNRSLLAGVVFSPIGDYEYVLALASNWVGIYDGYRNQQVSGIGDIGHGPDGLALAADGKLFVNAALSREVIVYDMSKSLDSSDQTAPPPLARIKTTDHDLLTPQLLLGKQIFYNSDDTRMGHSGYWSCASCHFGGIGDGRVWDFSDRGEGLRNTKTLLGIRGAQGEGRVHWSGNMDEIQDFERDIREDFLGSGFMPDAEYVARTLPDGSFDTFGKPSAGLSPDLDALAAYITSLAKVDRSPFRNPDGSFTADALAGRKIFASAGCPVCHNGADFTDSAAGVLHDVGTLLPTSGGRLGKPLTGLDTPTLKGVWQSAPYLHDGRAATLTEVVTKYNREDKMGKTSNLSPTEIDQLVAYMMQLDDVPETVATGGGGGTGGTSGTGGSGGASGAAVAPAPNRAKSSACSTVRVPAGSTLPTSCWLIGCGVLGVALRRRSRRFSSRTVRR